jgi:Uma2 family endonuclease
MTAMTTLHVPHDGWTVDELPDDLPFRYELVDGALLVSPPPRPRHDDVAAQLLLLLAPRLPPHWRIALTVGLYVDARNYRQPDLLIFERAALGKNRLEPADAVLVVEVMSPGSVSNDRVAKPHLYAACGIRHFWRIELDPIVLLVHELDGKDYRQAGRFTDDVVIDEPVPMRFRLADLLG